MKNRTVEKMICKFVLLLSWLSFVAGKPSSRCSQTSEIEHYDPSDPAAEIECKKCPECPEGLGLSPQCGSRATKDIKIECKQCLPNITYSDSDGIGSCKPCQECGLKNVIQHCTPDQKRICGTICPKGYFLDHNHICQECYFCCDNVRESNRRQGCKEIGMDRNWQCEKTEQNQRCKEAFDKVATKPTDAKSTVLQDYNHTMTEKILKTQVYETNLSHISTDGRSTPMGSTATRKRATFPANDDSTIALSKQQQKGQEDPGFLRVIIGVPSFIFITVSLALLISKREKLFRLLRTKQSKLADCTELLPLQSSEPADSGRTSQVSIEDEVSPAVSSGVMEKVNVPDSMKDVKLRDFPLYGEDFICKLNVKGGKNWRDVAYKFNVSSLNVEMIEQHPTELGRTRALIKKLGTQNISLKTFVDTLQELGQHEVVDDILSCYRARAVPCGARGSENNIPEDVMLKDCPASSAWDFIFGLDGNSPGVKNWRHLAQNFDVSTRVAEVINQELYRPNGSPIIALIEKLGAMNVSLRRFVDVLEEIERYDVADDIYNWYASHQRQYKSSSRASSPS